MLAQQGRVDKVAFTSDGRFFLTAARIENQGFILQKWDSQDGRLIGDPVEHLAGMVYALTTKAYTAGVDVNVHAASPPDKPMEPRQ